MPSDEPSRPYNWRPKSLAKLESIIALKEDYESLNTFSLKLAYMLNFCYL